MRISFGRRSPEDLPEGTSAGPARVDTRTKNLVTRLNPGDIAVIDHEDIDRVAAESLVRAKPAAVVNAAKSISGRYPNLGPEIIVKAGIPLVDDCGSAVMALRDGQKLTVNEDGEVHCRSDLIAEGEYLTEDSIQLQMLDARQGMSTQLKAFAHNTMEYMEKEYAILLDGVGMPEVRTKFADRHVLVVVRGYNYQEDLRALKPYIREYRPVLVGVDGGADAILEAGYTPDMIVGDMDSVSDKAITCGAEIVVHAYRNGKAPGHKRVQDLGVGHIIFPAPGTSEDIALLMADAKGAELIVAVGTHNSLVEFLDKGRAGMASTFLTRLRVGGRLVDAKGVSTFYRTRISGWMIFALALSMLLVFAAVVAITPAGRTSLGLFMAWVDSVIAWVKSLFTG